MKTIFLSILSFTFNSALSGITWDILKQKGEKLIENFKIKTLSKEYFNNEDDCYKFLEILFKKQATSTKRPLNDLRIEYEELTNKDYTKEFEDLFIEWIKENKNFFNENTSNNINQVGVVNINAEQTATDGGQIYNIANQYNN